MSITFETVWSRVQAHSGEPFTTVRGKTFTY